MRKNVFSRYYGSDRAAKAIYGTVLIFAYLITQNSSHEAGSAGLAVGTFLAAIAIVLAEIYSEVLGKTIKQKRRLSREQRYEIEKDTLAIMGVSYWPSFFFVLSSLGLFGVDTAFSISYFYCLVVLFVFSYWAGRMSSNTKTYALLQATITTAIGLLVVVAKYALGH